MIVDFIKVLFYEFKSRFAVKKVKYKRIGSCNQCGSCCSYMYSFDTYNEREFNLMTKIFPKYKRFKIIGKDENGNLIFACKLLTENGRCSDYKNRLKMCKNYPDPKIIQFGAKLHKKCGYKIIPEKNFEEYLGH